MFDILVLIILYCYFISNDYELYFYEGPMEDWQMLPNRLPS